MATRSTTVRTLALLGAGIVASLSGAPPGVAGGAAAPAGATALGPAAVARDVTLVTGQRVHVVTDHGRTTASAVRSAPDPASTLTTMQVAGHLYVVPLAARRYLGGSLDPALFDVTALASASATTGGPAAGRHAVTLTYAGSGRPSVPGVTITSASDGRATGYLTDASAASFGAALVGEARKAQTSGSANGALFGSVTRISPAGTASTGTTASPQGAFPMYTLVIRALDSRGRFISSGGGILMSTDDGRKANLFFFIENGRAKVSVPAGRYAAVSDELTVVGDGASYTDKVMIVTDYQVKNNLQTLTLDARKATAKVQPATFPVAATIESQTVDVLVSSADGFASLDFGVDASPGAEAYLPPTAPPAYGRVSENTTASAVDPSVPGGNYHIVGAWSDDGIPASQRHRAPALSAMDRRDSTFYADGPDRTGGIGVGILPPGAFGVFINIPSTALPVRRAEYTFGPAGSLSLTVVLANTEADDPGFVDEGFRPIVPGHIGSVSWMRNPLRLAAPDTTPGADFAASIACRTATSLLAALLPLDGVSYHSYEVFGRPDGTPVLHYVLYRNGVAIVDADDEFGEVVPVTAAAATYRVVETLDRAQSQPLLSTTLTTDVTFRSSGTSGASLPPGACPAGEGATALPLLRADVDPNGSLTGGVPVGKHDLTVTVDHPALAGTPTVTGVAVQARPTGSTGAWTSLPVTRTGAGRYAATLTSTRGQVGSTMDLRVDATDAAGGILHQTTTAALRIGN